MGEGTSVEVGRDDRIGTTWEGELFKGLVVRNDGAEGSLAAPAFLATRRSEAEWYATTLQGDDDARRVATYATARPLRVLRFGIGAEDYAATLASLGVTERAPGRVARALSPLGFDGLMLDGGSSGWHLVLGRTDVVVHVSTEPLEVVTPSP